MAAALLYALNNLGIVCPRPGDPALVGMPLGSFARPILTCLLLLSWAPSNSLGAGSTAPPPFAGEAEPTNVQAAAAAVLQLQEQLRATQLAIERNLLETKAAIAQNAATLSNGLQIVQDTFAVQQARELEAMQRSNQFMLRVGGALAAAGFLALLLVACFQWYMSRGLAEVAATLPTALKLVEEATSNSLGPAEQAALPLLNAPGLQGQPRREPGPRCPAGLMPRRGFGRTIERRLFPHPGDALRRRQFRALGLALLFGLIFAAVVALVLYLLYKGPRS